MRKVMWSSAALEGKSEADEGRTVRRHPGWSLRRSFAGGLYFASLLTVVWPSAPYRDPQRNAVYSSAALYACWYVLPASCLLLLSAPGLLVRYYSCAQPYHKYPHVTNHGIPSTQRTRKERPGPPKWIRGTC